MKKNRIAIFIGLLTTFVPLRLAAKGDMVKITIQGSALRAPIAITDRKIQQFTVWSGLGVNDVRIEQAEGFIIDWPKGNAGEPSAKLQRFEVSFYEGCRMDEPACHDPRPSLCYVVSYVYDPSTHAGSVYLPGKPDKWYNLNGGTIFRGVEGQWFHATSAWDNFVTPRIEEERKRNIDPP
jgi:hypothetical protein